MGLIGEILKGSQALRYHAKAADVAGKNLARVNDEDYARQRVLTKEAYMYADNFSLGTGGMSSDGLDHMRDELLDRRVVGAVGDVSSLDARKEILDLLQLVLGEKVNRQSLNAGLDDTHESDLVAGSLTRALNDFFNAYQELAAAPTEGSIRQELIHKAKTLVARINEMGSGFDELEEDLSERIQGQAEDANDLLAKIFRLNRDIERLEFRGNGKATDLRDLRQKALEDLAKIVDFTVEPHFNDKDEDPTSSPPSMIKLIVKDKDGNSINLLDSTGTKTLKTLVVQEPLDEKMIKKFDGKFGTASNGALEGDELLAFQKEFVQLEIVSDQQPSGDDAKEAQVRAIFDTQGKLSEVEVLDGGSGYDDSTKSINFTFSLPSAADVDTSTIAGQIDAFTSIGLRETLTTGTTKYVRTTDGLTESETEVVTTGFPADITLRSYEKGDVVVDGEDYYQVIAEEGTKPWDVTKEADDPDQTGALLSDTTKFLKLSAVPDEKSVPSYDEAKTRAAGYKKGDLVEQGDKYFQAIGDVGPVVEEDTGVTTQSYQAGDVVLYNGTYYQVLQDEAISTTAVVKEGTDLTGLDTTAGTEGGGFITLGSDLPILGEEQILSRTENQTFVKGEYLFDGKENRYYQATAEFQTSTEVTSAGGAFSPGSSTNLVEVNAFKLADGSIASRTGQSFDENKFEALSLSYVYPDESTSADASATVAIAEAVVKAGEIVGFKITNAGSGYPLTDSIFINHDTLGDVVLDVSSGSIHGYQQARQVELESFRQKLNTLVGDIVTKVNEIYNPDDQPGNYVFGFPAMLSRATQGTNQFLENQGLVAGTDYDASDGQFILYSDEVDPTTPYADTDTFTIVNATAFFPDDRGAQEELRLQDPSEFGGFIKTYVGARRMKYPSVENDLEWKGLDGKAGTSDDQQRSILLAYDNIPYRWEQGKKSFVFGDNFSFDLMIKEERNLAKALELDDGFTFDGLITTNTGEDGANEVALGIAELGNGDFTEQLATLTTDVGNSLGDVADNLEHHQMVEGLLLDERQAVSSVSLDEEVANLMRYQRAFQASARVITTLDSMLELVVMGLIR